MEAILSLGSNVTDKRHKLEEIVDILRNSFEVTAFSGFYETPALGGEKAPYLNAVIRIQSDENPEALNARFKLIENDLGRNAEARKRGDVPADIDLVIYDGRVIRPFDYRCEYFRIGFNQLDRIP